MYCPGPNAVGWSTDFGHLFFDNYGDAAFAAYMAHEYGHGAQQWFGFSRRLVPLHALQRGLR